MGSVEVNHPTDSQQSWDVQIASRFGLDFATGAYPDATNDFSYGAGFERPYLNVSKRHATVTTRFSEYTVRQIEYVGNMLTRLSLDFVQRTGPASPALRGQLRYNYLPASPRLLFNDSDPDGDTLTAVLLTGPANGTLVLDPNGTFQYTPNPDFSGTDSFTYRAFDGRLYSAPATVTLTVRPRPDVVGGPEVNGGAVQRSWVTQVALTFDTALDTALAQQAGAFTVRRVADGATVGTVTATAVVANGQTRVALTFGGANTESGSLADGRWMVVVKKNFVRTPAGVGLAADSTSPSFHRLFGDTDGDRDVDNGDFVRFRPALGAPANYRADLDWDGDGDIDNGDFVRFRPRLGTSLP